jgi:hypothetical protein
MGLLLEYYPRYSWDALFLTASLLLLIGMQSISFVATFLFLSLSLSTSLLLRLFFFYYFSHSFYYLVVPFGLIASDVGLDVLPHRCSHFTITEGIGAEGGMLKSLMGFFRVIPISYFSDSESR